MNKDQVRLLLSGVGEWNTWRKENPNARINLSYANLYGTSLSNANLSDADLFRAGLSNAELIHADLGNANLSGADLRDAKVSEKTVLPDGSQATSEWAESVGATFIKKIAEMTKE